MKRDVIQDWTDTIVEINSGDSRDVRYKVFVDGNRRIQEIRETDGTLIRKQELPEGMVNGRVSFEASVRHVLAELASA
ncbi:MAG: hypothetical protein R3192_12140 [Woeseiaceae bacterium]|nr:hypothetical protein [Woeseiaceae bacterium]